MNTAISRTGLLKCMTKLDLSIPEKGTRYTLPTLNELLFKLKSMDLINNTYYPASENLISNRVLNY